MSFPTLLNSSSKLTSNHHLWLFVSNTSWISRTTHLSKSDLHHHHHHHYKICLMKTTAFRKSGCEKKMKVFEQEGVVDGGDIELRIVNGGFEASLNRLSKWIVSLTFGAIVILRHDPEAMWLLSGSVLNTILAAVLKRVLNQDRPVSTLKSDPGMPSSHAQSIFFVAAYITDSMLGSFGVNVVTLLLGLVVLALASYLSWLRVSQQYHTLSQVLVGSILGSVFSVLWLWSWNVVIQEAYVSYLLIRVCVVLGAVGFSVAFTLYVIRHWFKDIYR